MSEVQSEEQCARYILAIMKQRDPRPGSVLFSPDMIPELDQLMQSGEFVKGIQYAIDMKWLVKEHKRWRLTMAGFTQVFNGEA